MKIPFNETLQIHEEYDGYNGHTINQADVVLLQYPLGYPMESTIALNGTKGNFPAKVSLDVTYWQDKTDSNGYFTGDR
jgi:hypothetical protein